MYSITNKAHPVHTASQKCYIHITCNMFTHHLHNTYILSLQAATLRLLVYPLQLLHVAIYVTTKSKALMVSYFKLIYDFIVTTPNKFAVLNYH